MSKAFFMFLRGTGSVINLTRALPQIMHLLKVKDSSGQSIFAWVIWLVSDLMILAYALSVEDLVLIFLQVTWAILVSYILFLIILFRNKK